VKFVVKSEGAFKFNDVKFEDVKFKIEFEGKCEEVKEDKFKEVEFDEFEE
ncbi:hypothetical protein M9458_021699, partial [Cirrhinus mrigala]